MRTALLIFLSILPAIVLLWYFNKQDKGRQEPRKLKRKIFTWGILIAIFAVIIELNIEDLFYFLNITEQSNFWLYVFLVAFVEAALVEEALKFWVVKTHVYNNKHFDEVMDGITYTIIASLGLATLENIFYVVEGGFSIAILRALVSVPAHALFSGVMGYYIGAAKFAKAPWISRSLLWKGFFFGVLYHGLFDFLLFSQTLLYLFVLPLMIVMAIHLKSKIKEAHFSDGVINRAPEKLTAKIILKTVLGVSFVLLGLGSIAGTLMLTQDPSSGYTKADIAPGAVFAIVLFFISYFLLRKPQNSP